MRAAWRRGHHQFDRDVDRRNRTPDVVPVGSHTQRVSGRLQSQKETFMTALETVALEPRAQAFIDALTKQPGKPIYQLSYQDARNVLEDLQAKDVKKLPVDIEDRTL